MPHSPPHQADAALEFLCDTRFHRRLTYTTNNTRHHVSYSDYGCASSSAVVLFFGGLLGGRMAYAPLDALAKKHRIRIIHADRPGLGGTDAVRLEERISTQLAAIPLLLRHLGIRQVSLAAHSFGAVYAVNVLLLYPHLMHPVAPYAAFFAPWVLPRHSGVKHLQAAALLPAGMIGRFSSVARWVNGTVASVVHMATGVSSGGASVPVENAATVAEQPRLDAEGLVSVQSERSGDAMCALDLDDPGAVNGLRTLITTFLFAENIDGAGQDAQLCLRKPRSVPWSTPGRPWADIDDAAGQLRGIIADESHAGRRWGVDAFHAETDAMVGERGREWFDGCWRGAPTGANEDGGIAYTSQIVAGADHDFILDPVFGASERWLERVAESFGTPAVEERSVE
ncbi:uncharacterized protein M421DRAFT_64431 [Didymella exigua CBS 183.55]|uniref:AB hydrolase-1 domain-containing protein n=1 Tax=Didymella exigua CBS 183.55 TaxID=1150837 RepID=A0A6A5RK92_9PLEO|nr:uncharacterized protein M421DRAFT_64431 [Didymella exigua CBS 183.55]KAF1927680.1 hypothetical protein M421DRAFT_64431 [Didymella exigua CBS 183.55]